MTFAEYITASKNTFVLKKIKIVNATEPKYKMAIMKSLLSRSVYPHFLLDTLTLDFNPCCCLSGLQCFTTTLQLCPLALLHLDQK